MLADLGISPDQVGDRKFYRGKGCDKCNNTGYKGRVGLFELMTMNDELRDMVMQNVTVDEMRRVATKHGMIPLRDYGLKFIFEGITTAEEIVRETVVDA